MIALSLRHLSVAGLGVPLRPCLDLGLGLPAVQAAGVPQAEHGLPQVRCLQKRLNDVLWLRLLAAGRTYARPPRGASLPSGRAARRSSRGVAARQPWRRGSAAGWQPRAATSEADNNRRGLVAAAKPPPTAGRQRQRRR